MCKCNAMFIKMKNSFWSVASLSLFISLHSHCRLQLYTSQSVFIVTFRDDRNFHDLSCFDVFYLLWLSRCRHLYYKAEATANGTPRLPPPPPPQLSASDSDPNLSWIPSSWSAWCAVPSAQMLCAAPTLTQACLDYLHPRWCNPVLGCRTSFLPSLFIFLSPLSRKGLLRM